MTFGIDPRRFPQVRAGPQAKVEQQEQFTKTVTPKTDGGVVFLAPGVTLPVNPTVARTHLFIRIGHGNTYAPTHTVGNARTTYKGLLSQITSQHSTYETLAKVITPLSHWVTPVAIVCDAFLYLDWLAVALYRGSLAGWLAVL